MKALLRPLNLIIIIAVLTFFGIGINRYSGSIDHKVSAAPQAPKELPKSPVPAPTPHLVGSIDPAAVFHLVNDERRKADLPALTFDPLLEVSARMKCEDMARLKYFSHDTPTGVKPWKFMEEAGVRYKTAAENLAVGQYSSTHVVDQWMNSKSHRDSILKDYTNMGIASCIAIDYSGGKGETVITVQHFSTPK